MISNLNLRVLGGDLSFWTYWGEEVIRTDIFGELFGQSFDWLRVVEVAVCGWVMKAEEKVLHRHVGLLVGLGRIVPI